MFSDIIRLRRSPLRTLALVGLASIVLTSCQSTAPKVTQVKKAKPTEYFAESLVGVKASPRVVNVALAPQPGSKVKRLPRGGGREMVGKPYKIRGKWYHPREDLDYKAQGTASWYGDAFHGRLTANGEIYDMNNLTAAHPTMPLPSYARVTNVKNGKSVIVRVNDRGPYAHNRLVDLSRRAAQLLDYTKAGTAQVQLEYIGRAPKDGQDDDYLIASYRENGAAASQEVLVASNESVVPPAAVTSFAAAPAAPLASSALEEGVVEGDLDGALQIRGALPTADQTLDAQANCLTLEPCASDEADGLLSGYTPSVSKKNGAAAFAAHDLKGDEAVHTPERILIGALSKAELKRAEKDLRAIADLKFENGSGVKLEVYATPNSAISMDDLLRRLWASGYESAFVVR